MQTPTLIPPPPPPPPPPPAIHAETPPQMRDSVEARPPGFGKWPWWTPLCALAAALLAMADPFLLLESADFPFLATVGEGLFGIALIGFALLFMSRFGGRPRPADLGLRATPSRAAVGWVVVARIAFGICAVMYITAVGDVTSNVPIRPIGGVEELDAIDIAIAVVVLAPLVEEIFFRGFMYGSLRGKLPVFWAALITGAVFAAIHPLFGAATWNLAPVLALAGIAMCLLYERTGSIWPAIAFHFIMNVGILTIVTGSATLALSLVGGAALLFLIAPWRFLRGRFGRGQEGSALTA